ncbi:uncharacterized protein TRAVEDRAFT_49107 [Trametes versicolor FP-101664 SS1]|uniref:uncharacterized protein n=1 Tax=Trametes versicolor (strain FP-101664) TaxID=717944 RepID=UPI00046223D4|nr:uncharacterized protein TRAVEDRAFT_49107 [Trametes versicolor FP-101664 SS1]EIW56268.1 hypothetical protein TRAVEDRAFT_49107 [Trametes versicolor FP-101664 SS1]
MHARRALPAARRAALLRVGLVQITQGENSPAQKRRRDPSTETRLSRIVKSQSLNCIDAVYNGWLYELRLPQRISHYCSVFAAYVSIMKGEELRFTPEELRNAHELVRTPMRRSDDSPIKTLADALALEMNKQVLTRHTLRIQHASAALLPRPAPHPGQARCALT